MEESIPNLCKDFLYAIVDFDGDNLIIETSHAHSIGIKPQTTEIDNESGIIICSDFQLSSYLSSSSKYPKLKELVSQALKSASRFLIKSKS